MVHQWMNMNLLVSQWNMEVARQFWLTPHVDSSLLNSAIISSVADGSLPQGKKPCKKLPFSTGLHLETLSSSSLCAIPTQENKG